jgi:hypothetical protein
MLNSLAPLSSTAALARSGELKKNATV